MGENFRELLKVGFSRLKLSRIMGNSNNTPIDNDAVVLNENFCGENCRELPQNREIRENFHSWKIPAIRYVRVDVA